MADSMLSKLEEQLRLGNYQEVSNFLTIEPDLLDTTAILCILAITKPARDNLPNREPFLLKCEEQLTKRYGVEKTNRLLAFRR